MTDLFYFIQESEAVFGQGVMRHEWSALWGAF